MALKWRDGPWVADTSAWARASHPAVSPQWEAAAVAGELIACPVITLELLFDAQDREQVEAVAAATSELRAAPITRARPTPRSVRSKTSPRTARTAPIACLFPTR